AEVQSQSVPADTYASKVSVEVLSSPTCPGEDLDAHRRQLGPYLWNEYLVARDDVLGEHDDAGLFANFHRAEVALLPGRERVPRREGAHRLLARHALLGLPAVVVIRAWATRDGGVDAVERIRTLHGKVRAAGDGDAGGEQRAPGVRAAQPLGAESLGRPRHVR